MKGRTLFCMKDVAITDGGKQIQKADTYEEALDKVKKCTQTDSAYLWNSKKKQLVEKPAKSRSGTWSKSLGSYLFVWADKIINQKSIEVKKTPVSLMKHETFQNGREGMHTWTQSRRIAKQKGCVLVSAEEAKEYINHHGPLV